MICVPDFHKKPWETDLWQHGPVPHLLWEELGCRDGTLYPKRWQRTRAVPLGIEFEIIRAACGNQPINVGSAYRTKMHNQRVGGARFSRHVEGIALDLVPPRSIRLPTFLETIIQVAHRPGGRIRGIGVYRTFIHIDIRKADRIARWRGSRVTPEVWKKLAAA